MDIKSFKKTKIDLSLLGFDMNGEFELYYCTPKKAQIIASSGVDGIHFCTIPQFGEIIFAVSPGRNFQVRDCLQNEQPKRKPRNQFEPQVSYDACCIGIIGGADGSTAVFVSAGQNSEQHQALSALRFEHADDIEWKIVFREKLLEDIETELL